MIEPRQSGLLHDVSRSIFWNTALLPIVTASGLVLSILVRRRFGLESGIYDVVLGVANSILFYSGLGLSGSLPKFLPELQVRAGRRAAARLVVRLGSIRLAIVIAILIPLNVWAQPFAQALALGPNGAVYLHSLSALLVGRATLDFAYRTLDSFFQQLSVNLLSLVHGVLDVCLVAMVLFMGWHMAGVIGALGVSALVMTLVTLITVFRYVRALPAATGASEQEPAPSRIWKLSGVTYFRDLALYFATPAFASPVLVTLLGGPEPVALFATSFFVASSTVTLVVSGFRGVYRPAFARVLAAGERPQLQRAFDLMTKVQILAVVPAGFGLGVMVADYLPLLYGEPFAAAVPVARVLVALLFAETAMAVGLVVLWMDERYRPVLGAQFVMIAGAPLFVFTAGRFGLLAAAAVLGGSRLASVVIAHVSARRVYGLRYPWPFAAKVTLVSSLMAGVLLTIRQSWHTSPLEASALTMLGMVIVAGGLRLFRVLGPEELDVLTRASIPGKRWLVPWLAGRAL